MRLFSSFSFFLKNAQDADSAQTFCSFYEVTYLCLAHRSLRGPAPIFLTKFATMCCRHASILTAAPLQVPPPLADGRNSRGPRAPSPPVFGGGGISVITESALGKPHPTSSRILFLIKRSASATGGHKIQIPPPTASQPLPCTCRPQDMLDVSVNPDNVLVYAASKGREFLDTEGHYQTAPMGRGAVGPRPLGPRITRTPPSGYSWSSPSSLMGRATAHSRQAVPSHPAPIPPPWFQNESSGIKKPSFFAQRPRQPCKWRSTTSEHRKDLTAQF